VCSISYARIQGRAALVAHFQNSSLMHEDKRCRPILFTAGGGESTDPEVFAAEGALAAQQAAGPGSPPAPGQSAAASSSIPSGPGSGPSGAGSPGEAAGVALGPSRLRAAASAASVAHGKPLVEAASAVSVSGAGASTGSLHSDMSGNR
jgi:hypothetical protein